MLVKHSIFYVDTDRDRHFTDSLIVNASEFENIVIPGAILPAGGAAGGGSGRGRVACFIESIRMTTATNHDFGFNFYSRDVGHQRLAASPYHGALIGTVLLNSITYTTGTEFYYATDGLSIPYLDEDNTGELHVALINFSSDTKGALGATLSAGVPPQYIQVRFGCIAAN